MTNKIKVVILKDEVYPEYWLETKNTRGLEVIEVSQEFYNEYLSTRKKWEEIQKRIGELY